MIAEPSLTMLKEILTLRYYPAMEGVKKASADAFVPKNSVDIKRIERILLDAFVSKVDWNNVSVALSGGVDSALMLAVLKKALPDVQIEALTVRFASGPDETEFAADIARKFDAKHRIIEVDNFLERLPEAIAITKMPFWDMHWIYVVDAVARSTRMLISGDGGDELFGGYTFRYEKFLKHFEHRMSPEERVMLYLTCHERDWVPDQENLFGKMAGFAWTDMHSILLPYFDNHLDPLNQVFLADYNGKLLCNWIPVNSALYRHFGIQSLSPLLSPKMVNYATHVGTNLKYQSDTGVGKLPLRTLLSQYLDLKALTPSKQGFSMDTVSLWTLGGMDLCTYYLDNARISRDGLISKDWIRTHLKRMRNEPNHIYVNKFFGLLACEVWYRMFVTNEMNGNERLDV